ADGVHRDLRVVAARLDAEVASDELVLQRINGEVREVDERFGALVCQAEAISPIRGSKEGGAESEGDGEPGCGEVERLARVIRRCIERAAHGAVWSDLAALRHPRGRRGPVLEQTNQIGARDVGDVVAREVEAVLRRGGDARLVLSVEGVACGRARGREEVVR